MRVLTVFALLVVSVTQALIDPTVDGACDVCIECAQCAECSQCDACSDCAPCSVCAGREEEDECEVCKPCAACNFCSDCAACDACSDCAPCMELSSPSSDVDDTEPEEEAEAAKVGSGYVVTRSSFPAFFPPVTARNPRPPTVTPNASGGSHTVLYARIKKRFPVHHAHEAKSSPLRRSAAAGLPASTHPKPRIPLWLEDHRAVSRAGGAGMQCTT
jgi:hypothetical protein